MVAVVGGTVAAVIDAPGDVVPLCLLASALQLWRGGTSSFARQTLATIWAGGLDADSAP